MFLNEKRYNDSYFYVIEALQLVKIWFLDRAHSCILAEPNLKITVKTVEKKAKLDERMSTKINNLMTLSHTPGLPLGGRPACRPGRA
jgi:hypothetical protein